MTGFGGTGCVRVSDCIHGVAQKMSVGCMIHTLHNKLRVCMFEKNGVGRLFLKKFNKAS